MTFVKNGCDITQRKMNGNKFKPKNPIFYVLSNFEIYFKMPFEEKIETFVSKKCFFLMFQIKQKKMK